MILEIQQQHWRMPSIRYIRLPSGFQLVGSIDKTANQSVLNAWRAAMSATVNSMSMTSSEQFCTECNSLCSGWGICKQVTKKKTTTNKKGRKRINQNFTPKLNIFVISAYSYLNIYLIEFFTQFYFQLLQSRFKDTFVFQ